ncbi:hypothetical protein HJG60_008300 [Phyllostomus discolor]|uniref:Uncharacterized protein n=1 Tax=Phyllostomus discolor TaxID=89673 RepID=A0A833ZB48_9CHIR|nr:hypothetical protein HJG60_008300 [Phyllostomus discolor]
MLGAGGSLSVTFLLQGGRSPSKLLCVLWSPRHSALPVLSQHLARHVVGPGTGCQVKEDSRLFHLTQQIRCPGLWQWAEPKEIPAPNSCQHRRQQIASLVGEEVWLVLRAPLSAVRVELAPASLVLSHRSQRAPAAQPCRLVFPPPPPDTYRLPHRHSLTP